MKGINLGRSAPEKALFGGENADINLKLPIPGRLAMNNQKLIMARPRETGKVRTLPKFAKTPEPPYYAVIFSSQRTEGDNGYTQIGERVVELAAQQPGFLGVESVRGADGFGITVSYWASAEAMAAWKANVEHLAAQEMGKQKWYEHYELRVAKVERAYAKPSA